MIVGSYCILYHFPDFYRKPKDLDYIEGGPVPMNPNDYKVECLKNPVLLDAEKYNSSGYCSKDNLYTLKMSHMFWDIRWEKHISDIMFLKDKGCKLNRDLFFKLYDYWNTVHEPNRRSNLQMSSEDFFTNALNLEHSHDFVHTLIKEVPTYTLILKDGAEVEVDENKFNQLTFEQKCSLVKEEVFVMAWERYSKYLHYIAYQKMLKKFIINHAPLWEAIFILDNFKELKTPCFNGVKGFNFIQHINNGLKRNQ